MQAVAPTASPVTDVIIVPQHVNKTSDAPGLGRQNAWRKEGAVPPRAEYSDTGALGTGDGARTGAEASRIPLAASTPGPTNANRESFTPDPEPCGASIRH